MSERVEVNGKIVTWRVSPYNAQKNISYYKDKIVKALSQIGIHGEYVDISMGGSGGYNADAWAKVEWWVNGEEHNYLQLHNYVF